MVAFRGVQGSGFRLHALERGADIQRVREAPLRILDEAAGDRRPQLGARGEPGR